jgi:hypothetical protein
VIAHRAAAEPSGSRFALTRLAQRGPDCAALLRSVVNSTTISYTSIVLGTGSFGNLDEL